MSQSDMLSQSILADVRAMCNLELGDSSFDAQLIPLINGQLMMAHQFGVGKNGFIVTELKDTWRDFLGEDGSQLSAIAIWLGYSVKLLFDPPDNSSVLKSYQDQIAKIEWMLCSKAAVNGITKNYVTEEQGKVYDELYKDAYKPEFKDFVLETSHRAIIDGDSETLLFT